MKHNARYTYKAKTLQYYIRDTLYRYINPFMIYLI